MHVYTYVDVWDACGVLWGKDNLRKSEREGDCEEKALWKLVGNAYGMRPSSTPTTVKIIQDNGSGMRRAKSL